MWTDKLSDFYQAVGPAFDFLLEERGYFGPDTLYGRDYALLYVGPTQDDKVFIHWERYDYAPLIFLQTIKDEGTVGIELRTILRKLQIAVDTRECALCEKLTREDTSFVWKMWIQLRRKREILLELPRYLQVYGDALRANHDAVLEHVHQEPVTIPIVGL